MAETITARHANQQFSRLLRDVAQGREFVITRNGKPVATLAPIAATPGERVLTPEQEQALEELIRTARELPPAPDADPTPFNREELYMERFERPRRDP